MKKQKIILIQIIIFAIILLSSYQVFATSIIDGEIEFSQSYLEYLGLADEEKQEVTIPRMYDIPKTELTVTNPIRLVRMLGSAANTSYSLRKIIPANMIAKNQMPTDTCWAFANIASLESNLALQDFKNGITSNPMVYDFSERHMDYATSDVFLNNQINEYGYNRSPGSSGVVGMPIAYLTNGLGAISEEEMEFQTNFNLIDISEIQGKNVITQVNDIITFPSYSATDDKAQIKQQMKEHIMNYGAINASIHGRSLQANSSVYNAATNAAYCNNSTTYKIDHAVAIVGWDDNYPVANFVAGNRPNNPGAWIVKNSWGEEYGDNGFLYISYEDVNIYKQLTGVVNAQTEITYENIYQYDEFGGFLKYKTSGTSKIYLATEFDTKTPGKEYLTQVSIYAPEEYTCKVYVSTNGTSKKREDWQHVKLKTGDTETIDAGYHTLEFLNPIKVNSDSFVVILEIEGTQSNSITTMVEMNYGEFYSDSKYANAANHVYDNVTISDGKCFLATEKEVNEDAWRDASKLNETSNGRLPNFDTTIKAFTTSKILESIEVTTPPTTTSYIEGQNFDRTGMVVQGNYANGDAIEITDYTIEDETELILGQTTVTISYNGFTTTQTIQVVEEPVQEPDIELDTKPDVEPDTEIIKNITGIKIKTKPTKTQYIQNKEKLDLSGGVIEISYSNSPTEEMPMTSNEITVSGFNNKTVGIQTITLTYEEKTAQFNIEIKELSKPENSNFDQIQATVKNIKAYYFTNDSKKEHIKFNIELNNIVTYQKNDEMKYYYYISTSPEETNIMDWIEISELNENANGLSFEINTLDVTNYEELASANTIYLYVKEVGIKNDMKAEAVSMALSLDVKNIDIEEYVDGYKKADVNSETILDSAPAKKEDTTVATETIPDAGKHMLRVFVIIAIAFIGRAAYLAYDDIKIK